MKNNDKTLLIMAAGMGSRYGGLKQIEPVGPNGEFMIDYSIYDAMLAGFKKVICIIKEENLEVFEETIGTRIKEHMPLEYVFQKMEDLPDGYSVPENRVKPWGTAHAILAAKDLIDGNFVVINADDFYGRDAYFVVSKFLDELEDNNSANYGLVGYKVKNTLTENGGVKRGVCEEENGYLKKLTESIVEEHDGVITATPLDGSSPFTVESETRVSMNMFGFTPEIFNYIEENFPTFLEKHKDTIEKCEFLIPDVLEDAVSKKRATVTMLRTNAMWQGVTYKEDKETVVKAIRKLIDEGIYKENLWK